MTAPTDRFRHFAARVLEHEGALVEYFAPDGLEAMLPTELQRHLRAPEMMRLSFGADLLPDAERVSLESDWLERLSGMLGAHGQQLYFVADVPLPEVTAAERMLEHGIELPNAIYRLLSVTPAFTRYWLFTVRYTAISDEQREGLLRLGVNTANGSALDAFVHELWQHVVNEEVPAAADEPFDSQLPPPWGATRQHAWLQRAVPERVRGQLQPFLHGMQRRLERDLARVLDYYDGLRQEAFRKLKRANADSAREQLRMDAAAREYHAKVGDLKQKYDLRVTLELTQALELICPVQRLELLIKRRKGERKLTLDWNPLVRALEPLPCEWSATAAGARIICDDKLHCVSVAGHAACEGCSKEYCRACSPSRCPKCGQATTPPA